MKILTVAKYNSMKQADYDNACQDYCPEMGSFPYLGSYCFLTSKGEPRKEGYVAFEDRKAFFAYTKEVAIKQFEGGKKS